MGKLTATGVAAALRKPGRYHDGDGLMLVVRGPGAASWIGRLQHEGRRREFGLGSEKDVSLAEARERCRAFRKALREGRDPLVLNERPQGLTRLFKETALAFLESQLTAEHQKKAKRRLEMYVFPRLGRLQLQSITADTVAECLRPIWQTKPVTALKLRNYIVRTLRFGREDGALLIGQLSRAISDRLPPQPHGKNHEALDYRRLPELMARLEGKNGMGALCLRAAILCASRSIEIRGARWDEIDFTNAVWDVPGSRMKGGKPHRVMLSSAAIAVFKQAAAIRRSETDLCFPSSKDGLLSDMAMTKALRDLGEKATQHGMRSTFKDWSRERADFADEISEAALAHQVPNAVKRAYLRTTFQDHRAVLMEMWGNFATSKGGDVVSLDARRAAADPQR